MKVSKQVSIDEFSDYLAGIAPKVKENLKVKIKLCCQKVQGDIKYSMDHTQRDLSKTYYTNNKSKAHHPSLPGNPPAPDTGNLKNTIRYEVNEEGREVYGIVGTTQKDPDYGLFLEYGTSKMEARPWLRPAMRENNDFIRQSLAKAVKEGLEK